MSASQRTLCLGLIASWFISAAPASAWWDGGHKVIAYLAYHHLTAPERQWVMDLLEANPTHKELFADKIAVELPPNADAESRQRWYFGQAAVWADLVRYNSGYENAQSISATYSRGERHYTDLPVFTSDAARLAMKAHDVPPLATWTAGQIEPDHPLNSLQTFAKIDAELPDPAIPVAERAVDLLWLFHLVGDTHQPCHCAQLFDPEKLPEGDRGANGIMILGLKYQSIGMNSDVLHAFWDSLFNGETNTPIDILARATDLRAKASLWENARSALAVTDPNAWLREGHALAKSTVYSPVLLQRLRSARVEVITKTSRSKGTRQEQTVMVSMPTAALHDYVATARQAADQLAVTAGLRLAAAIKRLHARSLAAPAFTAPADKP
jgi:hypothetical protein